MRKLDRTAQKLVEKRREAGDNSKKVREAEEEVREAGDVYPPAPPTSLDRVSHLLCDNKCSLSPFCIK